MTAKRILIHVIFLLSAFFTITSQATSITIQLYRTTEKGRGKSVGEVKGIDTSYGLLLIPNLYGLTPGEHGFHIHVYPDCSQKGNAAGGHLDPQNTQKHLGPYNAHGHLGDLPVLYVNKKGEAVTPVLAPRLTTKDLNNHAIIVHVGGDNYSDFPETLGGGGARFACGIDSL